MKIFFFFFKFKTFFFFFFFFFSNFTIDSVLLQVTHLLEGLADFHRILLDNVQSLPVYIFQAEMTEREKSENKRMCNAFHQLECRV